MSGPTTGTSAWRSLAISAASMSRWTTRRAGRERRELAGHAVVEARADGDEQVGLVQRPVRPLRPVHAGPAEEELVGLRERALRHQRRHDRAGGRLGEVAQLVGRVRVQHAAADVEDRPLRRGDRLRRLLHLACGGRCCGGFQPGRSTCAGYSKSISASCTSRGMSTSTGPQRPVRATWNAALITCGISSHVLHEPRVLDDRDRDAGDVALLERVGADQVRAHLAGDADERRRVHPRVGDRRDEVRRARARGRDRDADAAGRARVALGHVARRPARGARARGGSSCRARTRRRSAGSRRPGSPKTTSTPSASSERRIASAPFIFMRPRPRTRSAGRAAARPARGRRSAPSRGRVSGSGVRATAAESVSAAAPLAQALAEHQRGGEQHRARIGDALAGDLGRRAVRRAEDAGPARAERPHAATRSARCSRATSAAVCRPRAGRARRPAPRGSSTSRRTASPRPTRSTRCRRTRAPRPRRGGAAGRPRAPASAARGSATAISNARSTVHSQCSLGERRDERHLRPGVDAHATTEACRSSSASSASSAPPSSAGTSTASAPRRPAATPGGNGLP